MDRRRTCYRRTRFSNNCRYRETDNNNYDNIYDNNNKYTFHSLVDDFKAFSFRKLSENTSSALIAVSLIGLIFIVLQYNCYLYDTNKYWMNLTKNIDELSESLLQAKLSYYDLERRVTNVSMELPKIQGQFELLETLAQCGKAP